MGLDLKRCQHRQRNGGVTSLRWRVTIHTQLQEQTKLSAPVASPVGIGNGLNIALSVAGALTTTLDNPLCQIHSYGQTLRYFLGQTFSPPSNLEPGELAPGTEWAFIRVSSSGWGEFLTFVKDKPSRYQQVNSMLRGRANGN